MTSFRRTINCSGQTLLLLLFLLAAPYAAADSTPSPSSASSYEEINPSIAIVVVVLVMAFFLMGFISICIRHCAEPGAPDGTSRRYTAAFIWRLPHGLEPSVVESFPIFSYSEVKDRRIGNGGALECAVCINEFEDGEKLRLLPKCNHVFHPECIDAWLASHTTCPVCRTDQLSESSDSVGDSDRRIVQNLAADSRNLRSEVCESQNQVSITVDLDENRQVGCSETSRISNVVENPKQIQVRAAEMFPRSHSTGHSLVQPAESTERYTLHLSEEVRLQLMTPQLKRTKSWAVILPTDDADRSDQVERSNRWVFTVAPPFFWMAGSVAPLDAGSDESSVTNSAKAPSDFVAGKADSDDRESARPPV